MFGMYYLSSAEAEHNAHIAATRYWTESSIGVFLGIVVSHFPFHTFSTAIIYIRESDENRPNASERANKNEMNDMNILITARDAFSIFAAASALHTPYIYVIWPRHDMCVCVCVWSQIDCWQVHRSKSYCLMCECAKNECVSVKWLKNMSAKKNVVQWEIDKCVDANGKGLWDFICSA